MVCGGINKKAEDIRIMRKYVKPALCVMAALMMVTGCSKKAAEETTAAETETAAQEEAEIEKGKVTSLGEYKGVEVTRESVEVTDEELDARIQSILDANPEYVEITDRAAKEGDVVNIDFVGMKDGEAFEGGTSQGYDLELGSHSFIDGFEDGLIGARVGDELSLNLTFPEDYQKEDLAGQDVVFDVTVNGIQEVKDAVLDDNFVQRMSDFTTVDEFKADTLEDMKAEKEKQAEQKMQDDALQAVLDATEFELNQEAVDAWYEDQLSYYTSMIEMYGMTLTDYVTMFGMTEDQFKEELKTMAETAIKQQLVFEEIARVENFEITDEDRQYVADQVGMNLDVMKESYSDDLDQTATAYKVVRLITDNAVVK